MLIFRIPEFNIPSTMFIERTDMISHGFDSKTEIIKFL